MQGLRISFNGPVISRSAAANLASSIDAKFVYNLNWADPIGFFTTVNPAEQIVYGVLGIIVSVLIILLIIILFKRKKLTKEDFDKMKEDLRTTQKEILNSELWILANAILFVGGMATLLVDWFPVIAIGVIIFCPYSMVKNFKKYLKLRKYMENETSSQIS